MNMKKILVPLALFQLLFITSIAQLTLPIKLFRFGNAGNEKPAVITADGKRLNVSAFGEDYNEKFFANNGIERLEKWLAKSISKCPAVPVDARIGSAVARPSKIVAIGLNYLEHIKEGGGPTPPEPVIFLKATTSLSGPYDSVIIPKNSFKTDYEAELAIIIGTKASYIAEKDALDYIAGYTIINDYSEREWQLERAAGQWDKGKGANTFALLGPWLVTAKEVGDPHNLKIWLKVNGVTKQEASTSDMLFKVARLVSEVSQYMTLLPGDVIATGTPSGVGLGNKPPKYLKPGDVVELGIEKLGTQKQVVGTAMKYFLTDAEYKDYEEWTALGIGGIPHTLEGYRRVKMLGKGMKNPTDVGRFSDDIGKMGDIKTLSNLPQRDGNRPTIAPFAIPHRQMNQHNDTVIRKKQTQIFDETVGNPDYKLYYKTSNFEAHSPAIFLRDTLNANITVIPKSHGEVGHIHITDGSMHLTLSPSDAKEVIEKGWGELHGLAGDGPLIKTYLMIYSPRNDVELGVTKEILEAAVKYASLPVKQ
jgi:2-keto-4-pentenoate hydratase/2-oxohepta-3-ene-1,7-dioic acid hydratase in catechol pathway